MREWKEGGWVRRRKKASWTNYSNQQLEKGYRNPPVMIMMMGRTMEDRDGEHRVKVILGMWEYITRYAQGQGVQVVNVWHRHLSERILGVLYSPEGVEGVKEREWSSPTGYSQDNNPWRCPKCGSKPPDGGLMMATLKGAPL